ncbi:MAG: PIN domain-containing protein [Pseudomonadota bacterium]|nr:PIN domain-containing protein [Pseudomonadota bacterium]
MPYLLDTNIAIHLRDRDVPITLEVGRLEPPLLLSVVSRVELEGGVYVDPPKSAVRRLRLATMLRSLSVLPFNDVSADACRAIVEAAGYSRRKILDRMIAAQAIVHRATLVTTNGEDFRDVPWLELLEW